MSNDHDYQMQPDREQAPVQAVKRRRRRRYVRGGGHGCLVSVMYAAFIMGVSMILASFIILMTNDVFAFTSSDITVMVEIEEDDDFGEIAKKLGDADIIRYPWLFKLYLSVAKSDVEFPAGSYELSDQWDYPALARVLRNAPSTARETVRVTIPEGYTTAQIVELLVEKKVASAEELYEVIRNYDFRYECVKDFAKGTDTRLEGYLFPDTYEFYIDDKPENVIGKLISNFEKKFDEELIAFAEGRGMTMKEIVIIASMIEREAKRADERDIVSSVIYNRLNNADNFPYLQIDATVAYVVGHAPTPEDLTIDSPYNTYQNKGLPPGAICNPGLAAIESALYPEDTKYYYYVARDDGSHIFSKTLAEHEKAIASLKSDD
ncbi:MAG: endolytic transglycosylase MltG [Ruminococcaceae bacterium]|nr:endolytic transglycosylase MltG [Oscillospiraceae bacterium]